ncbi:MAG TPA: hypothetical protein VKB76_03965 [Ktedonobacterales bacterium]|nr:hypothetical protein [Ktedonobacterales bacterium]
MRWIFLSFEAALTVVWFWSTWGMLTILASGNGDGGTFIGMLLFLALGVGTAVMLGREIFLLVRHNHNTASNTGKP